MNDETRPSEEGTPPTPPEWSPPPPAAPAPPAVPPAPDAPAAPGPQAPSAVLPPAASTPQVAFEGGAGKRKLDVGMFLLGLATPFMVIGVVSAILAGFSALLYSDPVNGPGPIAASFGMVLGLLPTVLMLAAFVGSLVALIVGRTKGNNRLRSFGLGGVWAFGGILLLGLLAFGACFIALSGFPQ